MPDSTTASSPEDLSVSLEAARKEGFRRGVSSSLCLLALLSTLLTVFRIQYDLPRYTEVFKQVKLPLPGLTLLFLEYGTAISSILILSVVGSILMTWRFGNRLSAVWINIYCFFVAMICLLLEQIAMSQPMMFLLEGIGQRR
jgi:hypothetical protein